MTDPDEPSHEAPRASVEDLVFRCLELREGGDAAAVDALLADHPRERSEVRARLAALERSGLVAADGAASEFPEQLGDFRLLEPLGGGGMGLVFSAHQESLGREVALKLIRPEQLYFPGARERFEREVAIVARLQHPGIVPVYAFGDEGGVPYFAMERVPGCTLGEVLERVAGERSAAQSGRDLLALVSGAVRDGSGAAEDVASQGDVPVLFRGNWVEACLRIVRDVAEALEHAHRQGVLHRDVKPSNIMITPGGRVMLLDFGLSASEAGERLTRTGSQIGSLPYLPPERVAGAPFTRAADVYSLGVTLYELMTLRLPYAGGSAPELLGNISAGGAPGPRRLNPQVEWDADTVCRVAMEPELERRYADAGVFARDLTNALERRPILARRSGPLRRARRWARRSPGWAATVGALALVLVVAPWLFALRESRANARLERESRLAADSLERSLDAVREMLVVLGSRDIRDVPHLERRRRELLERALDVYAEIGAALAEGDGRLADVLELQRLAAEVAVGRVYAQLGRAEDAANAYRNAIARASAGRPWSRAPAARLAVARAHQGLARGFSAAAEHGAAAMEIDAGLGILAGVAGDTRELADEIARTRFDLSHTKAKDAWRAGDAEAAITALRDLLGHADPEGTAIPLLDRASARTSLGTFLYWELRLDEAAPILSAAVQEAERALRTTPELTRAKALLADANTNLGAVALSSKPRRAEEAVERFAAASALQEDLARAFPDSVEYASGFSTAVMNHGHALNYIPGRRGEALATIRRALPDIERLVATHPEDLEHAITLGHCLSVLAGLTLDHGHDARAEGDETSALARFEEALGLHEQGLARLEAVREARPDDQEALGMLKTALTGQSAGLIALGRHAEAAATVRRIVATPEPDWRRLRTCAGRFLMCAELVEGDATTRAGYVDEAMETMQAAVALGYRDREDLLENGLLEPLRAHPAFEELRTRVEAP